MTKAIPLFDHQNGDIQFELNSDVVLDTSDAGTGKTRTRLEVFSKRRANGAKCALVLASKSLLKPAWKNDCEKFTPWLTVSCCYAATREEDFAKPADIYVTNHDATTWLAKQPKSFFDKFDVLIVDESTAYKHHTSQRSRALNKIKKYFKYRICQTGTPNTNNITDLWNQVFILDDGKRLGKSFYAFRAATQTPKQVGPRINMVKWEDRPGIETSVSALISDITIRHKLDECHDIPPNHEYVVPYDLSTKTQQVYDQMKAASVASLKKGTVTAVNAAAVVTKLLQIASGAVYDDNENYQVVDTNRYELIGQLVEDRQFSVVFFLWKHQKDQLIKEFTRRGLTHTLIDGTVSSKKRDDAVSYYQSGFYRVLLVHPKSAAHGLTLTRGTATIWGSPTYDLEWWLQGNRRIYRAGQMNKTETINVIAKNTIEEYAHHVLINKKGKLTDFLEYLGVDRE